MPKVWIPIALAFVASVTISRPASACAWDNETIPAEGGSLACVYDAVLGSFPKRTGEYYQARLSAADAILAWDPYHVPSLDMKGVAALKLKRFDVAEAAMKLRLEIRPDDYASFANLGTLYTFTGAFDDALAFTEKALAKEPQAHFGREGYHKALIEYLRDLAKDPKLGEQNFLRVAVNGADRASGSEALFKKRGVKEDVFDAIVAMITVYGADGVPFVYHALGDMLALRGSPRLAWVAYTRAIELKHPTANAVAAQRAQVNARAKSEHERRHFGHVPTKEELAKDRDGHKLGAIGPGGVEGEYYLLKNQATGRDTYQAWERKAIAGGLAVWSDAGVKATYAKAHAVVPRCASPHVIDARAWESPK